MDLKLNSRNKTVKFTNKWKIKNIYLKNQFVKVIIKREITKFLETDKKKYKIYQHLKSTEKAVPRDVFIAINIYLKYIFNFTLKINTTFKPKRSLIKKE